MNEPHLESAEIIKVYEDRYELILNWSNERHHVVVLPIGKDRLHLIRALYRLVDTVMHDEYMGPLPYERNGT